MWGSPCAHPWGAQTRAAPRRAPQGDGSNGVREDMHHQGSQRGPKEPPQKGPKGVQNGSKNGSFWGSRPRNGPIWGSKITNLGCKTEQIWGLILVDRKTPIPDRRFCGRKKGGPFSPLDHRQKYLFWGYFGLFGGQNGSIWGLAH